jgi:hypothetical protein
MSRGEVTPTLAFKPNLQIASQSSLDCSEAAGEVNSIFAPSYQYVYGIHRRYVTHIVHTKVVQRLGDLNLLLGIEEGIGELFTLTQSTLDNLEAGDIAQEVANWLVWVVSGRVGVCFGLYGGEAWVVLD